MATINRAPLVTTKLEGPVYPVNLRTLTSAATVLALLIAAVPPPTVQRHTELPRTAPYPIELRTIAPDPSIVIQLAAVPAPTIHALTETPQAGPPYPVDLRTVAPDPSYALTVTGPVGSYLLRVPNQAPRYVPAYGPELRTWTYSPLETLLGFIPPSPPQTPTVELPRAASYPLELRTIAGAPSLSITTAAITLPIGGQAAATIPAAPYPTDLRTTISTLSPALQAGFQAYTRRVANVAPQPLPPWPISARTWTQNLLETTLAQPTTVPFGQFDWGLPQTSVYPLNLRTHVYFYVEDDNNPPQSSDTSTPRTSVYPTELRTWTYNALPVLISTQPFAQSDWPLPIPAVYPTELRTETHALTTGTLFVPPAVPPGDLVTETTPGAPYPVSLRTTAVSLLQTTLFVAPQTPIVKAAFPNPQTSVYPLDLRTHLVNDLNVLSSTQPVGQYDWPARPGAMYPVSLRTHVVNLQQTTLFVAPQTPIGDTVTETPRAAFYPFTYRSFVDWNLSTRNIQVLVRRMINRSVGSRSEEDHG